MILILQILERVHQLLHLRATDLVYDSLLPNQVLIEFQLGRLRRRPLRLRMVHVLMTPTILRVLPLDSLRMDLHGLAFEIEVSFRRRLKIHGRWLLHVQIAVQLIHSLDLPHIFLEYGILQIYFIVLTAQTVDADLLLFRCYANLIRNFAQRSQRHDLNLLLIEHSLQLVIDERLTFRWHLIVLCLFQYGFRRL